MPEALVWVLAWICKKRILFLTHSWGNVCLISVPEYQGAASWDILGIKAACPSGQDTCPINSLELPLLFITMSVFVLEAQGHRYYVREACSLSEDLSP